MVRTLLTIFSLLSISVCANFESDDIYGAWILKDYSKGAYQYSLISFSDSGRKCVVSFEFDKNGEPILDYWDNLYKIEGSYLITVITKSSTSLTPPKTTIRDEIVILNNEQMEVLMESDSDYYKLVMEKHERLHDEKADRICNLVDDYFSSKTASNKGRIRAGKK